ncbi:MAG TPA: molybdopterin-binding protein, partial [Clostridia bacterium]|nr:molybdopterin-binding protein [Clostridia bacterium]
MLKCEVISIGTELLMGQIVNTDAQYISSRLPECGVGVFYHSVIGDNPGRIKEALKIGFERCDVVITTGGLGPTQDDLTKEIVADFLGLKLVLDDRSSERIRKYFEDRGRVLVESNLRQAYFPEGSIIVENDMGTAPGCIVEKDDKVIVMLPCPPKELIPMFDKVMKYFKEKQLGRLFSKYI